MVDFRRIIIALVGAVVDRPAPNQTILDTLFFADGVEPALENTYRTGIKIAQSFQRGLDTKFERVIPTPDCVGDILGSLGGNRDLGPNGAFGFNPVNPPGKRGFKRSLRG